MNQKIKECMEIILSKDWTIGEETKKIWEWIRDEKLTFSPAFKGELYDKASVKIMYVGHAVNGWEVNVEDCTSLESTVECFISQKDGLKTLVDKPEGYEYTLNGRKRCYKHINSHFLRLIKGILEELGESDGPISEDSWYRDSKKWNEKIVWTNLYNVAPREGGNPHDQMIKPSMEQYVEMFRLQIEEYKPNIVIVCPLSGYFVPCEKSFDEVLDDYHEWEEDNRVIIASGKLGNSEVILCRRPDRRGISKEGVSKMAEEISKYIKRLQFI